MPSSEGIGGPPGVSNAAEGGCAQTFTIRTLLIQPSREADLGSSATAQKVEAGFVYRA